MRVCATARVVSRLSKSWGYLSVRRKFQVRMIGFAEETCVSFVETGYCVTQRDMQASAEAE